MMHRTVNLDGITLSGTEKFIEFCLKKGKSRHLIFNDINVNNTAVKTQKNLNLFSQSLAYAQKFTKSLSYGHF